MIRLVLSAIVLFATAAFAAPSDYFAIHVIDDQSGRGIPLVYLRSTFKATYVTDSAGYVACLEPGLMDGNGLWLEVRSCGYDTPVGLYGVQGVQVKPTPGGSVEIKLHRTQPAERLYRMTGYGIYRDSVLLGKPVPMDQPLINAQVTGQDSVQVVNYRDKLYWFWGDTNQLGFGLGNFHSTGATSASPAKLDPDLGIHFDYFTEKPGSFVRGIVELPDVGSHPIWIDALTAVPDKVGREHLIARYSLVNEKMVTLREGLIQLNDEHDRFELLVDFVGPPPHRPVPAGHPIRAKDGSQTYVLYPNSVRVKAEFEIASDPKNYEAFTCVGDDGAVQKKSDGALIWRWQRGGQPIDFSESKRLVKENELTREQTPYPTIDVDTGKPIQISNGSIAWNDYLNRWTYVFGQFGGDSTVGEIWLATANSPQGPWREAKKLATHAMPQNNNDFYNPIQHEELQKDNGRIIYFEGTFVNTFSGNPWPTPYYDYNNIMYRVDLSDSRLKLPEPPKGLSDLQPVK